MSQYLRHLVARSRGTLDAVRPRVPARFEAWAEPPQAIAEADPDAPPARWTEPRAPRADHAETRRPPAVHVQRPAVPRAAGTPDVLPSDRLTVSAEARTTKPGQPAVDAPSPFPPDPFTRDPLTRDPAALPPGALELPAIPLAPPVPARREAMFGPAGRSRAHERLAPVAAEREETVVHVTIGRIDVRAAPSPPASIPASIPGTRPAAPTRSLEDWLAGRSRR